MNRLLHNPICEWLQKNLQSLLSRKRKPQLNTWQLEKHVMESVPLSGVFATLRAVGSIPKLPISVWHAQQFLKGFRGGVVAYHSKNMPAIRKTKTKNTQGNSSLGQDSLKTFSWAQDKHIHVYLNFAHVCEKVRVSFRLMLTMDPKYGEISRAMRNRGVEIYMPGEVRGISPSLARMSLVI